MVVVMSDIQIVLEQRLISFQFIKYNGREDLSSVILFKQSCACGQNCTCVVAPCSVTDIQFSCIGLIQPSALTIKYVLLYRYFKSKTTGNVKQENYFAKWQLLVVLKYLFVSTDFKH